MNILPKLLFLSLALANIAQADNDQKKLKDPIKAHNEKRKTYNHNSTRTITEQKAYSEPLCQDTK